MMNPVQKAAHRDRQKLRSERFRQAGRCTNCGRPLDTEGNYYEKRVDDRLFYIKQAEEKAAEALKRKGERKARPREWLRKRRAESLERAAYNEYQAKLLTIRSDKQYATAARIERLLDEPPAADAVDPVGDRDLDTSTRV